MDFKKVVPELSVVAKCMESLSWMTLVVVVLAVVLLTVLLTGNSYVFWILVGSVVGAVLINTLVNSKG